MSSNSEVTNTSPEQLEQSTGVTYSPLPEGADSFRLLRILPSLRFLKLRCELFVASIKNSQNKYIAGSYVWGPPEPSRSILLNGTPFTVRKNLWHFLHACSSKYKTHILWIDAICINQSDVQERSAQVQEMKRIYSGATCVYSWLGYRSSLYTGLFDRELVKQIRTLVYNTSRRVQEHDQVLDLDKVEYWERMWILQEFLLAKDVYLLAKRRKLPFTKLDPEIGRFEVAWGGRGLGANGTMSTLWGLRRGRHRLDFENLFTVFGSLSRSLPRDRVFALLGLVGDREQDLELVKVIDYTTTSWQLLLAILATKALRRPLEFIAYYSSRVLEEQEDMCRMSAVSLEFDVYMRLERYGPHNLLQENFEDQPYSRTEMQRFSIYMDSKNRNNDYIDERVYIDRCPATHKE
jgi:hypothetical protein